jgi:hypothetical protein
LAKGRGDVYGIMSVVEHNELIGKTKQNLHRKNLVFGITVILKQPKTDDKDKTNKFDVAPLSTNQKKR